VNTYIFVLRLCRAFEFERTVICEAESIIEATAMVADEYGRDLESYAVHQASPFRDQVGEKEIIGRKESV
jgi:hypothetical protein